MPAALVTGTFNPPHMGHVKLVKAAIEKRNHVVIVVLAQPHDRLAAHDRARALMQDCVAEGVIESAMTIVHGYESTPYKPDNPDVAKSNARVIEAHLRHTPPVDLLVTSEINGEQFAELLGLHSFSFDPERTLVPVSSTQIRDGLAKNWHLLGPGSRELLAIRAVFIGAESTGTTTTTLAVQAELIKRGGNFTSTNWIREYGRDLTMRKAEQAEAMALPEYEVPWTTNDFVEIAIVQQQLEDVAARTGGPVVCCDTDVFATIIWERRYLGGKASLPMPADSQNRIYFVTQPDGVPFVQDKIRNSEGLRETMTREFEDELISTGRSWMALDGSVETRVAIALDAIDAAMAQAFDFHMH
jgi:HTH-type transcriptional regulator, transcriptional repressor of NAD biosynthesis genes